jgi:O-antigen ligase
VLGGLLGLTAIAQAISWNNMLLWFRDRPPGSMPLGPFVNPSHYAGFVEMSVLIAVGLSLALVAAHGGKLDREAVRAAILDDRWTLPRLVLAGACVVLGIAGILISESRGALIALAAGLMVLVIARRSRVVIAVLLIAILLVGLAAGLVALVGEGEEDIGSVPFALGSADPSGALRLQAWGATMRMFLDYPAFGAGVGTFRWVFPEYQRGGEWKEWRYAHNDYVQLLGEAGLAGAVLLIWALFRLWNRVLAPVIGGAVTAPRWTSIAAAAAVITMLVHTVVDFNLQIPSNAGLFAVVLGVLAASAGDPPAEEVD